MAVNEARRASAKFSRYLDLAHDGFVEGFDILGGDPIFPMIAAARFVDLVSFDKLTPHLKAGNVPEPAGWDIPVPRDLHGVLFR